MQYASLTSTEGQMRLQVETSRLNARGYTFIACDYSVLHCMFRVLCLVFGLHVPRVVSRIQYI